MAGIFDGALIDPRMAGLLSGAFAGLNASGPSPTPVSLGQVIGRAGAAGMGAYQDAAAQQLAQRRAEQAMKLQEQQMGLMGIQQQLAMQNAQRQAEMLARETARREAVGGILGKVGTLKSGAPTVENAANPQYYTEQDALAELRKNNYLTDAEMLVKAMPKLDTVNLGGQTRVVDLRATPAGTTFQETMKPGESAKLAWDQFQHNNPSAYQRAQLQNEGAGLGMRRAELLYNTGMTGVGGGAGIPSGGFPMGGGAPSARAVPQAYSNDGTPVAPATSSQLPLKARNALAQKEAELRMEADIKKEKGASGLVDAINEAEKLLKKNPTGSFIGAGVDMGGRVFGVQPKSAETAAQLKSVAAVLTSKMPRMEGPQSNYDVAQYERAAGDVGNETLPVATRLAALQTVRQLQAKYDKSAPADNATPVRRYNPATGRLE